MAETGEHNCRNDEKIIADIDKYGLSVIIVDATDYLPSFAYSIGLWKNYCHPEIICFGLSLQLLHQLINDVADLVKDGKAIEINKTYWDFFEKGRVQFVSVDERNLHDYFGTAIDIYDTDDFPALQFVWTDKNESFPWEENFQEEFVYRQPLLDRNASFKFREPKNLAAFTTKWWVNQKKAIVHVIHDADGDWHFLTNDEYSIENSSIVELEQIVLADETLNQVFDLDYGQQAERESIGAKWVRSNFAFTDE